MKDLEKIKSEDLGCQVADANPGNFAIEQEVGAMVGATVPQPTAPSADDARELGAQLLVFLRRALTPIKSALRTALADIYAHLDSRCTDYTPAAYASYIPSPYDPMRPFVPRTLPNLLTAITAFAPRKISNGSATNDGIKDGESLAQIVCTTPVTKLIDDNRGWKMTKHNLGIFPSLTEVSLGCGEIEASPSQNSNFISSSVYTKLDFTAVRKITINNSQTGCVYAPNAIVDMSSIEEYAGYMNHHSSGFALISACANTKVDLSKLRTMSSTGSLVGGGMAIPLIANSANLKEIDLSSFGAFNTGQQSANNNKVYYFRNCPNVERIKVGRLTSFNSINFMCYGDDNTTMLKLVDFEIGQDTAINLNLTYWNPTDKGTTFLQNFLEHICQRLANRTGQTKLTLTLSAGVYTAIMTDNDIKAELVARNWKVTDGTNNFNN